MMLIGVDYYPRIQTIAFFVEESGEYGEQELVVAAVARELLGFVWAIGAKAEAAQEKTERRAA